MSDTKVHPKVTAATVGAALATVTIWLVESTTAVAVPAGVTAAVTTLLTLIAGYIVSE
jgi:hypothetical protein